MLHHVSIEVEPGVVDRAREFWGLLGFEEVKPPASLSETTWFERGGTQIHLIHVTEPTVPEAGHPAVVVEDLEAAFARLDEAGFEVRRRSEHWGAARAKAIAPGGHVVELMAAPPPSGDLGALRGP
jgi:catechol 2,3-dioxygenase-like lactoylglutathione lyase family enzyme